MINLHDIIDYISQTTNDQRRNMAKIVLKLDDRQVVGKKVAKLRASGIIPSVVYGEGKPGVNTQSKQGETIKVIEEVGRHTPFDIELNGKKSLAIVKTIDVDTVKHKIQHLAFQTIKQNEVIETEVAIELTNLGESPAERAGLIVLQAIEKINIKALPADLPESLTISVLGLETEEDKLLIKDIPLPKGVEYSDVEQDLDLVVANVYEPGALEAANAAAAGDGEDESNVESDQGGESASAESKTSNEE